MGKLTKGLFSSNTDLWATPQDFFDKLNEEFHFNLDPCALPENAKCTKYFTPAEDGLKQNWGGQGILQSTIRKSNRRMGKEMLRGKPKTKYDCGDAYTSTNRHVVFSRLHLSQCRPALHTRTAAFQRGKTRRTIPVNGGDIPQRWGRQDTLSINVHSCKSQTGGG